MNKLIPIFFVFLFSCNNQANLPKISMQVAGSNPVFKQINSYDSVITTIHVFVALCDNKYQGIVPVPEKIGNGQDLNNNLYWGCGNGISSYFRKSLHWTLLKKYSLDSIRMERLVFKCTTGNYFLIADAYNGKNIRDCTVDFLESCSGQIKDTLQINRQTIGINGNAKLLAYIGHDGLMDFKLTQPFHNTDNRHRKAIILACYSKHFFSPHLLETGASPLLWSTGLMSPEAYTLHDALDGYLLDENDEQIRMRAAKAYASHQHCSVIAAQHLLVTGK